MRALSALRIVSSSVAVFALLAGLAIPVARDVEAQQQPDLDGLASQMAAAIQESLKDFPTEARGVLVVDFDETHSATSQLGHVLASEFADALRKHAQGFVVLSGDDLWQAVMSHNLPDATLSNLAAMKCYAPDLGAAVLVERGMEYAPDGVVLRIGTWRTKPRKSIFGKLVVVPMTAHMTQLAAKPAPSLPPFFTHEARTWVSPDHPPVNDDKVVLPGAQNYTYPACISCRFAPYPDDAVWTRLGGTVVLRVQILADGLPSKIFLVRGLPCGLTDKAFEAVEHWKFTPATVDGKPVATETEVESTFHVE